MSDIQVKLDEKALAALRSSPEVEELISSIAQRWTEEANATLSEGSGYQMAVHRNVSKRGAYVVARVYTVTKHAMNSNAKYQTLARIVGR